MKLAKIIPISILFLIVSVTIVSANHTSSITITPNSWAKNTAKDISVVVTNTNDASIIKIELFVPETVDQVPIYTIKDVTTPSVCKESESKRTGQFYPYKIIWECSGIESGKSLTFGLTATSPTVFGDYKWNWKTTDADSGTYTGFAITTSGQAAVSYFVISNVPTTIEAGKSFNINVRAYGDDNQIKKDYTGKITFASTDVYAVLPVDYTFQASDLGSKDFTITYKNSGDQTFTIKDTVAGVSTTSTKTTVKAATVSDIGINPENKKVSAGEKVEYKVLAKDAYGNVLDVTDKATFKIDSKAGGTWSKNVYTSQNEGTWVVIATYNSLVSGTTLVVSKGAVTPPITPPVTPPAGNVTPPEEVSEMSLSIPEKISIGPGANDTMIITVNNNGERDLTGVEIKVGGVPSDWVSIYPLLNDIPSKSSKDYLVILFVPQNESGTKTIDFTAESSEGANALKSTELTISSAPTGTFAMPKNVLQLGVVIIAVAAVVIIGWELWFKKPKAK